LSVGALRSEVLKADSGPGNGGGSELRVEGTLTQNDVAGRTVTITQRCGGSVRLTQPTG